MSRTFRRQDVARYIDTSRNYSRVAGYYTIEDKDPETGSWTLYRHPTADELFRLFRDLHCDGRRHYRFVGMPKWGRRLEMKIDRAKHREKITRYLKGIDDDVVVEKHAVFPHRYW